MLAILTNVYSKLRGVPQDWYITGASFVGALLLMALSIFLTWRKKAKPSSLEAIRETNTSLELDRGTVEGYHG